MNTAKLWIKIGQDKPIKIATVITDKHPYGKMRYTFTFDAFVNHPNVLYFVNSADKEQFTLLGKTYSRETAPKIQLLHIFSNN